MLKSKKAKLIGITIYSSAICIVIGCMFLIINTAKKYANDLKDYNYVVDGVFEQIIPVVAKDTTIIKPYVETEVSIGKSFYNYEGTKDTQEKSLIFYENTYMQNSGVDYIHGKEFDIVAILDGTILNITEDKTLGKTIQIKHDNELISVYQGVDNINVDIGNTVNQGTIIASSAPSRFYDNTSNLLHFEIYHKGELLDPESIYTLSIKDFN